MGAKFKGNCLILDNVSCTCENVVNLFVVFELDARLKDLNADFTLGDCVFGAHAAAAADDDDDDDDDYDDDDEDDDFDDELFIWYG